MLTALTGLLTRFRYAKPAPAQAMSRQDAFLEAERIARDEQAAADLYARRDAADKALEAAKGAAADATVEMILAHRRCADFGAAIYHRRSIVDNRLRETADPRLIEVIAALTAAKDRLSGQFTFAEQWQPTGNEYKGPTKVLKEVCTNGLEIEARAVEIIDAIAEVRALYSEDLSGEALEVRLLDIVGDLLEPVGR